MDSTAQRYILAPVQGFHTSAANVGEMQLFANLHALYNTEGSHILSSSTGVSISLKVIDSIGEGKPKLVECDPKDLPALRASHPNMRILPLVFYRAAVKDRERIQHAAGMAAAAAAGVGAGPAAASAISVRVVSASSGAAISDVTVVAFTDFAHRAGAEGTTDASGSVQLSLGGASVSIERLYAYPPTDPAAGVWPGLLQNLTLTSGASISLLDVDLTYIDCVRHFYPGNGLTPGKGVTVGVVDSGVALDHSDLTVSGGANTVQGETSTDFGDNHTEGHGTHVAGIIAAHGTPPAGILGIAPGVTLRSYRVFGNGQSESSNFDIAKAVDTAISDGCTLLNLSLGGPQDSPPDPGLADAITAAHNAGVLVFVANGNDGRKHVTFPANATFSQAVSAIGRTATFPPATEPEGSVAAPFGADPANFIAEFSNIGPETDFTGPGVGVISTLPGGYGVMSGTSMATPAAVGAAARVLAANPAILAMPADAARTAAMLAALAAATRSLGFTPTFQGKGIISS